MAEFEPNGWQKRALDIHVIDKPGEWGTCVFLDDDGVIYPHLQKRVFTIGAPISQLKEFIRQKDRLQKLEADLISQRGEKFAAQPTENEQLKIDRIFLELCKFPEISQPLFGVPLLSIVAGDDHFRTFRESSSIPFGGYDAFLNSVMLSDLCLNKEDQLSRTILEEMLHALVQYNKKARLLPNGIALTPVGEMQSLVDEAAKIKLLRVDEQMTKIRNLFGRQDANQTLQELRKVGLSLRQDSGTDILGTVDRFMQDILGVYTKEAYASETAEVRSEELYVKCMKSYMICNRESHEFGEFFLNRLNMPAVAQGLREDRSHLLALYHKTPEAERRKGDLYAESVAQELKKQGVETGFNFGRGLG